MRVCASAADGYMEPESHVTLRNCGCDCTRTGRHYCHNLSSTSSLNTQRLRSSRSKSYECRAAAPLNRSKAPDGSYPTILLSVERRGKTFRTRIAGSPD